MSIAVSLPITTLPLSSILVSDRERTDLGNIDELMTSLVTWGQLMPLLVRKEDNRLIDGGRRYEALTRLNAESALVLFREDTTDDELKILEFEANDQRKSFTWKEKVRGIRKIHRMRKLQAARISESWTYEATGRLLNVQLAQVSYALVVAEALDDPSHPVQNATGVTDALNIISKLREDEVTKLLAASTATAAGVINKPKLPTFTPLPNPEQVSKSSLDDLGSDDALEETPSPIEAVSEPTNAEQNQLATSANSLPIIPLSEMFHLMSAEDFLPLLADESVDHFVSDPPYGIDMGNLDQSTNSGMQNIDRVEESHQVLPNLELLKFFIQQSFRALRPGGWCVFWYDLDHHEKLQAWAKEAGYSPMRWPFLWIKSHPCINQQAAKNWTKSTEVAMCLRKGNATLVKQQPTNFVVADGRIDRGRYRNPFAKPQQVWEAIYSAIAIRGQIVCDPFAGEQSSALAAIQLGLRPLTCEKFDHHFNAGMEHVRTLYKNMLNGKVDFQ